MSEPQQSLPPASTPDPEARVKLLVEGLTAIRQLLEQSQRDLEQDKGLDLVVNVLANMHDTLSKMLKGEFQEDPPKYVT